MKFYFKNKQFKKMRWFWVATLLIVIWQVYYNLTGREMLKNNNPTEWDANGKGYHK